MGGSTSPPPTTITTTAATPPRLRRENFRHTKHDSAFSKWKVLIGPNDWADYRAQKEGAERYRVGNLPTVIGPGVYEIGVAVFSSFSGRVVDKLDPDRIVVVYLGQADNVRSRLQDYGRCGSHLVAGFGLFKEVFSRGYPILYRWAPMKSKSDAERTEAKLLQTFDYAWNKIGNGARRPNDILSKIEKISSQNSSFPKIMKILQSLNEQKVGIPIKAEKLSLGNKPPSHDIYDEKLNLFDRVFKFSRSQPRLVPTNPNPGIEDSNPKHIICGVISSDGSTCSSPPVKGRKRCSKHKGLRMNQPKSSNLKPVVERPQCNDYIAGICGVKLGDGRCCERQPVKGRKRCEQHKGMRVDAYVSKLSSLRDKWLNSEHTDDFILVKV